MSNHDAAHGIHRVTLDDATVERAARTHFERINNGYPWAAQSDSMKDMYRRDIRAVLAAAVEAGQ